MHRALLLLALILGACGSTPTRSMMMHPQPVVESMWKSRHLYAITGDHVVRAHFELSQPRAEGYDTLRFVVDLENKDPVWAHIGAWKSRVYVDGMDYNPKGSRERWRYHLGDRWRGQGVILFRGQKIVGDHDCHIVLELKRRDKTYLFVWNFHPENLSKR
jgi:hypothetical protein